MPPIKQLNDMAKVGRWMRVELLYAGPRTDGCSPLLITKLVLELRPPERPTFEALLGSLADVAELRGELLFIAIVWANHRYPMRCASEATPSLLWFNFAHLFFDVAASSLYCLDGVERTRAAAGGLLRDRLLFGERDLYRADVGAHSLDARREDSTKGAQDHAHAVRDDTMPLRCSYSRGAEATCWPGDLHLLPHRLPKARTSLG
jgi:hypothetical protein